MLLVKRTLFFNDFFFSKLFLFWGGLNIWHTVTKSRKQTNFFHSVSYTHYCHTQQIKDTFLHVTWCHNSHKTSLTLQFSPDTFVTLFVTVCHHCLTVMSVTNNEWNYDTNLVSLEYFSSTCLWWTRTTKRRSSTTEGGRLCCGSSFFHDFKPLVGSYTGGW